MKKYFPVLQHVNIPNLITTLGLAFGVAGCYFLTIGSLRGTILCLSFAALIDLVDGFLAGKLNQRTIFGQELDSLVDFFVCCIMPVLMMLVFVGNSILLICAALFACACGLWRLANYNITASEKRAYFTGLPVPGGAMLLAISIWLVTYYDFPTWFCALVFFLTGLLMVSS